MEKIKETEIDAKHEFLTRGIAHKRQGNNYDELIKNANLQYKGKKSLNVVDSEYWYGELYGYPVVRIISKIKNRRNEFDCIFITSGNTKKRED